MSFLALIFGGTLLLKVPAATPAGQPIGWIDALFTATSASCITGLAVRDTGTGFTLFGQLVILGLIQAGGVGVMTFWLFILAFFRGQVTLVQRSLFEQTLAGSGGAHIWAVLRLVFGFTFASEVAGAVLLFVRWRPEMGAGRACWQAVFHSVSAFCNAGFALHSGSLTPWRSDLWVMLTISGLIILGGLGFFTVHEIIQSRRSRLPLSVHSKLALLGSAFLLLAGTGFIWTLEAHRALVGMGMGEKILAAFFQSVTTRTAGFNSVDIGRLSVGTLFFMILLMFIGGSPGSCAGGIKTTTLGVLAVAVIARLRGHVHVNVFRRTLSPSTLRNTMTIALGGAAGVLPAIFALLLFQAPVDSVAQQHGLFIDYLFETVSALGTVGLSTGITSQLTPASRFLVSVLMFFGRLGPLTLANALAPDRGASRDWRHPEEEVMVG
jgi:trk system potassium uptake protein TrkH